MKDLSTTHVPQELLQKKATRKSIIQARSYRKANWCLVWLACVEALRRYQAGQALTPSIIKHEFVFFLICVFY